MYVFRINVLRKLPFLNTLFYAVFSSFLFLIGVKVTFSIYLCRYRYPRRTVSLSLIYIYIYFFFFFFFTIYYLTAFFLWLFFLICLCSFINTVNAILIFCILFNGIHVFLGVTWVSSFVAISGATDHKTHGSDHTTDFESRIGSFFGSAKKSCVNY